MIGKIVEVSVDRPLGSHHPEYGEIVYPVNYGFIKDVMSADGEEQDAYVLGVDRPVESFTGRVIAVIHRRDDVEEKWVVAPDGMDFSDGEILRMTHFQEQYFDIEIRR